MAGSGHAEGTTKSAIATGAVTITDNTKQQSTTDKDAQQTIATLNRDTQHANGSIDNPFNQQKVQEQLEFIQLAGQLIIQPVAAQAAKWIGDTLDGTSKVAAHAVLGAAVTTLLGTGWQTGAAAGALGDLLPQALQKAFEKDASGRIKNEEAFKAANTIISAALTSATGGDIAQTINAGMVTQNAVANNWLKHQEKLDRSKYSADCKTGNQDACNNATKLELLDKLRNRDLLNACVNLSPEACAAQLNLDPAAKAYLVENFYTIGFGRVVAQFGENAQKAAPPQQLTDIAISLIPVVGDVTGFAQAESPFDYTLAIIGALGPAGDAAKTLVKEAKLLSETGDAAKAAEKLDEANKSINFMRANLQHSLDRGHGADFGVLGNTNNTTIKQFQDAVNQHLTSQNTKVVNGSYRGNPVTHFVDANTGLNVIKDANGNFLSGWKLSPAQLKNVLERGKL
ncbi:colicin D domain-containing protein [Methylophilus sp. 5]|uniref:colicin D domain-containing protein n=1 Tax=Methylophilus sp. 5 TaxID=1112274 RepID=UPI00048D8608|nr:colicin D domain-containing protein [Methylophilus sp. 5]